MKNLQIISKFLTDEVKLTAKGAVRRKPIVPFEVVYYLMSNTNTNEVR